MSSVFFLSIKSVISLHKEIQVIWQFVSGKSMLPAIHCLVTLQMLSNDSVDCLFVCSNIFLWTQVNSDWSVILWLLFFPCPMFQNERHYVCSFPSLWYLIYLTPALNDNTNGSENALGKPLTILEWSRSSPSLIFFLLLAKILSLLSWFWEY